MSYLHGASVDQYNDTLLHLKVRPYGSPGGQIFFSFIFMVWILLANIFLIFLIIKDNTLRRQPHNIFVFFLCLWDISIALFYLPLNMDFHAKGHWEHGCSALNVWTWYHLLHVSACTFIVWLLNFSRLCSTCSCCRRSPLSMKTRYILHGLALIATLLFVGFTVGMWVSGRITTATADYRHYTNPEYIGLYSEGERFTTTCDILSGFEFIFRWIMAVEVFWLEIYLAVVFLAVILCRVTRFGAPEKLNPDSSQVPLKVLILVTLVSLLLPGQFMWFICVNLPAPCAFLLIQGPNYNCDGNVAGLSIFFQWLMLSKSGVLPLTWFFGEDYRKAAGPTIQRLRPLWKPITRLRRSVKTRMDQS